VDWPHQHHQSGHVITFICVGQKTLKKNDNNIMNWFYDFKDQSGKKKKKNLLNKVK